MTFREVDRVLVLSPNWLGDAIMALPAIGDVRRRFPRARLMVAARRSIASLFTMSPHVNEVIPLDWSGGLSAQRSRRADIAALRSLGAEVAVLLPNSFASAWLVRRARIHERWGYATDLRRPLLSRAVRRPAIRVHQAEYYRRLLKGLGIENGPLDSQLNVPPHALDSARDLLQAAGWEARRQYVVMAPGAAYGGAKRWPAEHFAEVATRLARERAVRCVLVGSAADTLVTRWVRTLVPSDTSAGVLDLAGLTTLDSLGGVMARASACVSNDSGAMHLAAAVGVPLVALFGPTRERETAPLARHGRRVEVVINHVWCRPCMLRECPLDHRCMKGLSPERVFAVVAEMLDASHADSPTIPDSRILDPEP
jgi:heptosyltransferase-2